MVSFNILLNFKCGIFSVVDDGKMFKVVGKILIEVFSIFLQGSVFVQVWGLYVVDFSKFGVLSIVDSSDKIVFIKVMLVDMKDFIGDVLVIFSQLGLSGWVFKNVQFQSVCYDVKKLVMVIFKDSGVVQFFGSVVVDVKKGIIQVKYNVF